MLAAKISGSYEDYLKMMENKYRTKNKILKHDVLVIDSYDGAIHTNTSKGRESIISFSSQMFSQSTVESGDTTAKSLNIMTWQQVRGDENLCTLFPSLKHVFDSQAKIRDRNGNLIPGITLWFFALHDGKMLYILTQHSLYNCCHHPFLLCKCKRGEGVNNENHECKIISDDDQVYYWERSLRRWNDKRKRSCELYLQRHHRDWVDEHNFGISHYGFHPHKLPRNMLRFDVLHLRCSITRRLMSSLRKFMLTQSIELLMQFSDLLATFWIPRNVLVWNLNLGFQSMNGKELLAFINNTGLIVEFLQEKFVKTATRTNVSDGLILWSKISPFLVITALEKDKYNNELIQFKRRLKQFYNVGKSSFLTKNPAFVGDDETFYMHTLRFYLPQIAEQTFEKFGLGLGIFTMQGFERRNKESKNTLSRFSNGIGNTLIANLKRLWDVFQFETNNT